jgi:hypothetical protein
MIVRFLPSLILLLMLCSGACAATISIAPSSLSGPGGTGSALISLDSAEKGLSGYILSVSPENPQIATITGATFPSWAALSEATPGTGAAYTIRALDLNDGVGPGARDVPLATLNLKAMAAGNTRIMAEIKQMDDDSGDPVTAQISPGSVTVGGGGGQNFDLTLVPGWNFIGIPMTLTSGANTAEIFKDVPSAGHSLFSYDSLSGWKTVGRSEVISGMNAYWVYSSRQMTITLQVQGRPTTPKSLGTGWSIIGIPGTTQVPAAQALASISGWTYVIGFDGSLQQYKQPIIKGGSGQNSDQTPLIPGSGYWIYLSSPGQLIP